MLQKDRILISESGKPYTVCEVISSGTGQADVYRVSSEGASYALKLFYEGDKEEMKRQIQILFKRGKACSSYVHPLDMLFVDGRVGYLMEYIPDSYLSGSALCNGVLRDGHREELPFHMKIAVLYSLATAISVLYQANLALMDLKFDNFKINPTDGSVKILDTDTVISSGNGTPIIEGTIGFMPPLTMARKERPSKYNDSYALAVMIFMALIGSHPLMGKMSEKPHDIDMETYLFAKNPTYVWHPTDTSNRPIRAHRMTAKRLAKYPKCFLDAMKRTFVDGLYDKEKRPTPQEWCEILLAVYEDYFCCSVCGEEQFFSNRGRDLCDACGEKLLIPLMLKGETQIPMYFGSIVQASDLWPDMPCLPFAKIVSTAYSGKHGLLVQEKPIKVAFPSGETVEFSKGKVAPLFLYATYEYQNKYFIIKENK